MPDCLLTLDPAFAVGVVPERLFGVLVEHMGRGIYGGIFEPGHPEADERGMRTDVLELTRELGISLARYPGGNFVSSYLWEDGVGPVAERPRRFDLAWRSIEPNTFGLDEFMSWARSAGVEPLLAVNLGTRGVEEACALLEYVNGPGGTAHADQRVANGVPDPYGVRLWCLGNEMDGPWQIGQKTAREYGHLAAETAKAMRRIDPDLELVAAGSSNGRMPTFGSWEAEVLDATFDYVDYISLHAYFEQTDGDRAAFLASGFVMDQLIEGVVATCDHVAAKKRSRRRLKIAFDEWNVWYESRFVGQDHLAVATAPRLIEDTYSVEDAVVVGSLLISLLRHADRVEIACLAQLVNVIAPIRAEPDGRAWQQSIFHPFALTARFARGEVLRVEPVGPLLATEALGDVPAIDAIATRDSDTGEIAMFAVNRHQSESMIVRVAMPALEPQTVVEHLSVGGPEVDALASDPAHHLPRNGQRGRVDDGVLTFELPAVSWTLLRLVPTSRLASEVKTSRGEERDGDHRA